jgi:hypothetical protein
MEYELKTQDKKGAGQSSRPVRGFNELPQDWPDHLNHEAHVDPITKVVPAGRALLDFLMPGETFEQFCWWLLTKERKLHGCQRLGGSGTAQGGIDLFAYDEQFPELLNVYECKAWTSFTPARLTKAISEFLKSEWAPITKSFTLIIAQEEIGRALASRWQTERQRLKFAGIEADLWAADSLTEKVQAFPDVLSEFFPGAHVETFGNIWMQRVGFIEALSKALYDRRPLIADRARQLLAASVASGESDSTEAHVGFMQSLGGSWQALPSTFIVDGSFRRGTLNGRHWMYRGPWFSLSAMLPDKSSVGASAAFNFTQGDLKGITLTAGNDWLLKNFLFSAGTPLAERRGFVLGLMPGVEGEYVIDLPNSRLTLRAEIAQEMANVADLLTVVVRDALRSIEESWSAADFPFINWDGARKVALGAIQRTVWNEVGRFAEAHDNEKGDTPWHMFDGSRNVLKPWNDQPNKDYDAGYHAVITSSDDLSFSSNDEVTLLWEPDDLVSNRAPSSRGWWPCEETLRWLNNSLLPEVKRTVLEREYGAWWRRVLKPRKYREFSEYLDEIFIVRDIRTSSLVHDGCIAMDVIAALKELQYFYAGLRSRDLYLSQQSVELLYKSIAILATGGRGYLGYVASSLGLRPPPANHSELIVAVNNLVESGQIVANTSVADYGLRAMLELLGDSEEWLTTSQSASVKKMLLPLAEIRDDAMLARRHSSSA